MCYNELMEWIKITDIILAISILILGLCAILGLIQWISRGSIKKVDKQILWLLLPAVLLVVTYLLFDKVLPEIFPGMPHRPNNPEEPSFPSTHVMVVTTIFFCVSAALPKYTKSKTLITILDILMFILASLTATGRIISQMHTYVDVIGAVVFSFIFYEIYYSCIHKKKKAKKDPEDE